MKRRSAAELYEQLCKPLPPEALTVMGNGQITYRVTWVYDRLNKVLGPQGWSSKPQVTSTLPLKETDDEGRPYWEATAKVRIDLPALGKGVFRIGQGGYKNTDRGNAEKGAVSDAVKNAMKGDIGKEIHMGLVNPFDVQAPSELKAYKLGFQNGFSEAKAGKTLDEAIDADSYQTKRS